MMMPTRRTATGSLAALAALFAAGLSGLIGPASAADPVNKLDSKSGAAIKGYDPVAYFVQGKPVAGKEEHAVTRDGARWLFSSAENKALFEQDPAKYTPAYGGYCAYGVAAGYLVKIEPDAWAIRDGKLYLNYDKSVQKQWERNPAQQIKSADANWPKLISKK